MLERLDSNIFFIYEKEIEYLLAATEILSPYKINAKIRDVYDDAFVGKKKEEYPLLFEFYENIAKHYSMGWFEFLLVYDLNAFSLENFFAYLKGLDKETFLSRYLQMPKEIIHKIRISESELVRFYQEHKDVFSSFFAVEVLFRKTEWLLGNYCCFVLELRTKAAEKYLKQYANVVAGWKQQVADGTKADGGLHYSEIVMGKTFHNRGPYEDFYFMPAVFLPMRACRWFEERQILIFDAIRPNDSENLPMADILKMMSDKTRYKILVLLKEKKSLNGIEIADHMKLATSTVSHHMTQLRNCGLVHEEPDGNTKYYSLNQNQIRDFLLTLEKTLL